MPISSDRRPCSGEVDGLRVLLLHNPSAGDDDHEPKNLVRIVEAAGHEVRWQWVKEPGWETALDEPGDLVAVAGGDGTVRKVFSGLAGKSILATILPVGTANNIARSLGFAQEEPEALVHGWVTGRRRACDVGSLSAYGETVTFVESCGGGLFADLLLRADDDAPHEAEADDKVELGLKVLQRAAADARPRPWRVRLDDHELAEDLVGLEVMNVREAGPQVPLAPEADPGDGLLDVVPLRAEDAEALAAFAEARLSGRRVDAPSPETWRARDVRLWPPHRSVLHFDDKILAEEVAADNPVEAIVRCTERVNLLVPTEYL
jgi:diacylglycerol kinase family enzyme